MILGERIFYHSSLIPPFDPLDVQVLAAVQALKLIVRYNTTYVWKMLRKLDILSLNTTQISLFLWSCCPFAFIFGFMI